MARGKIDDYGWCACFTPNIYYYNYSPTDYNTLYVERLLLLQNVHEPKRFSFYSFASIRSI